MAGHPDHGGDAGAAGQQKHKLMGAPKVLAVSYGGGHIGMILPVIQELERHGINCLLLALTTGYSHARQSRLSRPGQTLGYKDFLHLVDRAAVYDWGMKLMANNSSPDVPVDETIAYLGINYLDLIEQFGEEGARQLYAKMGRYAFMPIPFMRRVLHEVAPDLTLATNSPRSEYAALYVSMERGVPCVGMVDLFGQNGDTYVTREIRPNATCVLSESVKVRLVEQGFLPNEVHVTGNPAFDRLFESDILDRAKKFKEQLGLGDVSPVLWAGNVEPSIAHRYRRHGMYGFAVTVEKVLRRYVARHRDRALIVRYHPSQWHGFPKLPPQLRVHVSVALKEPIHEVILASAGVVVQNSTVGVQAAIAGKPVVSLESAPSVAESFSLAQMGISYPCYAVKDLEEVVERSLTRQVPLAREFISDGKAACRVAHIIHGLMRKSA
ncbi:MAG TPA: UDP-N-acetylglucosamine 2-epimerase [Burkholderiaceae bacterium]|nr:UDP-N-acetylglucosamine 2-epimerase [Burkholderiaceae bacterium]